MNAVASDLTTDMVSDRLGMKGLGDNSSLFH
jgi:hypothetical protein